MLSTNLDAKTARPVLASGGYRKPRSPQTWIIEDDCGRILATHDRTGILVPLQFTSEADAFAALANI